MKTTKLKLKFKYKKGDILRSTYHSLKDEDKNCQLIIIGYKAHLYKIQRLDGKKFSKQYDNNPDGDFKTILYSEYFLQPWPVCPKYFYEN